MGILRRDLIALSDAERAAVVGRAPLNGQLSTQHKIVVRGLGVRVPGNDVAGASVKTRAVTSAPSTTVSTPLIV
jgi:hypothetical protein